jgi:hypothetical protein
MPSLLTSNQITVFTGIFADHFSTFSREGARQITVHKEPLKTLNVSTPLPVYGYESSNETSYSYTPVYSSFPAIIVYTPVQQTKELEELKNSINKGEVRIKVEQDCRDYIEDGRKTERVEFDGKSYNMISSDGVQNFLGLIYYIYKLENTT